MRDIHVAADDDGLLLVEPLDIHAEILFPAHAVHQPRQPALAVGRVDRDKVKLVVFERDQPPFMVMQIAVHAHFDRKRRLPGENRRAGIAFFLS